MKRKGFIKGMAAVLGLGAFPGRPVPAKLPVQAQPPPGTCHVRPNDMVRYHKAMGYPDEYVNALANTLTWKVPVPSKRDLPLTAIAGDSRVVEDTGNVYTAVEGKGWVHIQGTS